MSGTYGHQDPTGPWVTEHAICAHCGHRWIAVHPCCYELECPACRAFSRSQHAIAVDDWIDRELEGMD